MSINTRKQGKETHLTRPKDPPALSHHGLERTQIARPVKYKRHIPDKLIPRIPLVLDDTRETEDPVPPERTRDEPMLERRLADNVFAYLREIEERARGSRRAGGHVSDGGVARRRRRRIAQR